MTLGPHASFIVAAYVLALVILLTLIAWIAFDHCRQKRALRALEEGGITRRATRDAQDTP